MWYVTRDQAGRVNGKNSFPVYDSQGVMLTDPEPLPDDHPDLYPPATKEERISFILATKGRGKDRTTIQLTIEFAEMVAAPKYADYYGVSVELAIMGLYARNKTYRECKDTEAACLAVEQEP